MHYIKDGGSKTYKALCEQVDCNIIKKEDINHVNKKIGTRLRNLKKQYEKTLLEDGKTIGGAGCLAARVITLCTDYYGKAIRSNIYSLDQIYNGIWATYYHKISTDSHPQHHLCPPGQKRRC